MRKHAWAFEATIQCITYLYNFCYWKVQFLWCTFQTHFSMGRFKIVPFIIVFHLTWPIQGCKCFDFTKLYLIWRPDHKSRIWKKYIYFFHYHLNLFICCKAKLKVKLIFYRMSLFYRISFFTEWIFFNRINFLKGDTNIYFK